MLHRKAEPLDWLLALSIADAIVQRLIKSNEAEHHQILDDCLIVFGLYFDG